MSKLPQPKATASAAAAAPSIARVGGGGKVAPPSRLLAPTAASAARHAVEESNSMLPPPPPASVPPHSSTAASAAAAVTGKKGAKKGKAAPPIAVDTHATTPTGSTPTAATSAAPSSTPTASESISHAQASKPAGPAAVAAKKKFDMMGISELKRLHETVVEENNTLKERVEQLGQEKELAVKEMRVRVSDLEAELNREQQNRTAIERKLAEATESASKAHEEAQDKCLRAQRHCEEQLSDMRVAHADEIHELQAALIKADARITELENALEKCGTDPVSLLPFEEAESDRVTREADRRALLDNLDQQHEMIQAGKARILQKMNNFKSMMSKVNEMRDVLLPGRRRLSATCDLLLSPTRAAIAMMASAPRTPVQLDLASPQAADNFFSPSTVEAV